MLCSADANFDAIGYTFDFPLHFKYKKSKQRKKTKSNESSDNLESSINDDLHNYMKLFDPSFLVKKHGDLNVKLIIGKKNLYEIEWPEKQSNVEVTLNQYNNWLNDSKDEKFVGKLFKFPKEKYWAYLSYQRIFKLFSSNLKIYDSCLPWEQIFDYFEDFSQKSGKDLNLWWGSEGSYTPCHFDSYGFNLVFQIAGSKRWLMFPPSEYHKMYSTRIPFEETSVFSQVNIPKPNIDTHPLYAVSTSFEVVLEEGDILLVPKHWWHYAEALTNSTSINCWFDLDCDIFDRMKEIITNIHIDTYMNQNTFREEWILTLLHMNKTIKEKILCFEDSRKNKSNAENGKSSSCDFLSFKSFNCSCDPTKPFFKQIHSVKGLNLSLKHPSRYKISKICKINKTMLPTQPAFISKASQLLGKDSKHQKDVTVKEISDFINSICDYSTLDSIIDNLKYSRV